MAQTAPPAAGGRRKGWRAEDIGDLTGRTAVVTGANSGLGLATALELARRGAHVVLACRDADRGRRAADRVRSAAPDATPAVVHLDLAAQASVRAAAAELHHRLDRLDVLVDNAGVMATPFALTEDGFERQFATNHLGPFALTGLLLDLLLTTSGSRVVTVSSAAHRMGALRLGSADGLQGLGGTYHPWLAYANTKLANLLFTAELERRLRAAGAATLAVAAHPGVARTELTANGPLLGAAGWRARAGRLSAHFGRSAEAGALPTLYAATAPGVAGGALYGPGGPFEQFGPPARVEPSRHATRADDAARLWALSEELTGVTYALGERQAGAGGPVGRAAAVSLAAPDDARGTSRSPG